MTPWQVEVSAGAGVRPPVGEAELEEAVCHVLRAERAPACELSVALVDDGAIARINAEYLDHEGPTDVISFALPTPGGPLVGDVYLGVDQARRQAEQLGVDAGEELIRLAVHGTLHVLGYDHPEDADQRADSPMYLRQEELLREILRARPRAQ